MFMSSFFVYIWQMKSSATDMYLSYSLLLNFLVSMRSLVESERSFRYDKRLVVNKLPLQYIQNENRKLRTYHSYCNPGWYVPNQSNSVDDQKFLDLYLELSLRYGKVFQFNKYYFSQKWPGSPFYVSRGGRLHFFFYLRPKSYLS